MKKIIFFTASILIIFSLVMGCLSDSPKLYNCPDGRQVTSLTLCVTPTPRATPVISSVPTPAPTSIPTPTIGPNATPIITTPPNPTATPAPTQTPTSVPTPYLDQRPDMVISAITRSSNGYTITVCNNGGDSAEGRTFRTLISSSISSNQYYEDHPVMHSNSCLVVAASYTDLGIYSGDSVAITAVADYDQVISEINEHNNELSTQFTVTPLPTAQPIVTATPSPTATPTPTPVPTPTPEPSFDHLTVNLYYGIIRTNASSYWTGRYVRITSERYNAFVLGNSSDVSAIIALDDMQGSGVANASWGTAFMHDIDGWWVPTSGTRNAPMPSYVTYNYDTGKTTIIQVYGKPVSGKYPKTIAIRDNPNGQYVENIELVTSLVNGTAGEFTSADYTAQSGDIPMPIGYITPRGSVLQNMNMGNAAISYAQN